MSIQDRHNFAIRRIIVSTVAACTLLLVATVCILSWFGHPVPDAIDRMCHLTCGGLIGMLAKMTTDTLTTKEVEVKKDGNNDGSSAQI